MTDEHEGMGGSYTLDPKTGKRVLVDRTHDPLLPSDGPNAPKEAAAPVIDPAPVVRKVKDEI